MRGVVYVAYGYQAIRCLRFSLQSLALYEPSLPVIALSDQVVNGVPTTVVKAEDIGARSVKTRLPDLVPQEWQHILYIDVDTVILKDLGRFFIPLAHGWDIVMCQDELAWTVAECRLKHRREMRATIKRYGTGDLAQFAGGVFAWARNAQTRTFFQTWHKEWRRWKYRDQGALVRALARVPIKLWPLSARVNASAKVDAIEVWHKHGMARRRGAQ